MREEIKKVLEMLNDKKITNDEAAELIDALGQTKKEEQDLSPENRKRFIKIHVTKGGKPQVNVTLPFGLINWGLNMASKMGKNTVDIGGESIPLDMEELSKAMNDPKFSGKIMDVTEEEEGKHIEIEIV